MVYLTVVTAAGKSLFLSSDDRYRVQIVRREKVVTTTGMQNSHARHKRQQLYLSLAVPPLK